MRFVQRQGTVGTIDFVGDEARLLRGGEVVVAWTGGALVDVPQGDGYVLEVRSGGVVTTEAVAIGAIVVAMGQSNIDRWFTGQTAIPATAGTYQLGPTGWGEVKGAGGRIFAAELAEALGAPVAVVNAAVGDTALTPEAANAKGYWLDTAPGSLYADALALLDQAGTRAPELVLWSQGERDANVSVAEAVYAAALTELFERIQADLEAPILVSELGTHLNPVRVPPYDAIRAAQQAVVAAMPGVDMGATNLDIEIDDITHRTGVGYAVTADRMAIAAAAILGADIARAPQAGTPGPDTLAGGETGDDLQGGDGDDTLTGAGGSDVLFGAEGDDLLHGGDGIDIMRGWLGADRLLGGAGSDLLGGGQGDDLIEGGADADEIAGDDGDDRLQGGAGDDVIAGGDGDDEAVFAGVAAGYGWSTPNGLLVVHDLDLADGDDGDDLLSSVEVLRFADISVRLSGTAPSLFGDGADTVDLSTLRSTDYAPGTQYDALAGDDVVALPTDAAAAIAAGWDATVTFHAGTGADRITGSGLDDRVAGDAGDDTADGGAGTDRAVYAGVAAGYDWSWVDDIFIVTDVDASDGDEGTDTLTGFELLSFLDGDVAVPPPPAEPMPLFTTAADTVDMNTVAAGSYVEGTQYDALAGGDVVVLPTDAAAALVAGWDPARTFLGGDGNDRLTGGTLADGLSGGAGDDVLSGGGGDDVLAGGAGRDTASYGSQAVAVSVDLKILAAQDTRGAGRDLLSGIEELIGGGGADFLYGDHGANRLVGGAGNDRLESFKGDDTLEGEGGNDILLGGRGDDRLVGGAGVDKLTALDGRDVFVVGAATDSTRTARDTVMDFVVGTDRLDLGAIDANPLADGDQAFAFIGTAAFTGAPGQLRLVASAKGWIAYGDIDGDRVADLGVNLNTTGLPTADSFIL